MHKIFFITKLTTKGILLSSLFLGLQFAGLSAVAANEVEEQAYDSPIVGELIKIQQDRLVFRGKSVRVPYTRKKLIAVFGKPSREIYNTAGTVVIWDELGLTCYGCEQQSKAPEEFQFMTNEEKKNVTAQAYIDSITLFARKYNPYPDREKKYSHEPEHPFQGRLELDGVEIDGSLTFYEFIENRKSKSTILLPENSFSFFIRCKPAPHEITLHTIRDKYDDDFMSIYSVSIRNIGHYYNNIKCYEKFSVAPRPEDPEAESDESAPVTEAVPAAKSEQAPEPIPEF